MKYYLIVSDRRAYFACYFQTHFSEGRMAKLLSFENEISELKKSYLVTVSFTVLGIGSGVTSEVSHLTTHNTVINIKYS